MDEIKLQLGAQIRNLRKLLGYTQAQLAELTDLSDNFIGQIERGERTPTIQTLKKFADALNIKIEDFFHFPDEKLDERDKILSEFITYLKNKDIRTIQLIIEITKKIIDRLKID
ncbi:MAG: helix-turn-helix transcriptional regulator [bacterium]